jgi:cysteine sulfinate desulfinase/cysteine desulfurase-like protein
MRLPDHVINGSARFSFGQFTTMAEIDYTLSALKRIWKRLSGK